MTGSVPASAVPLGVMSDVWARESIPFLLCRLRPNPGLCHLRPNPGPCHLRPTPGPCQPRPTAGLCRLRPRTRLLRPRPRAGRCPWLDADPCFPGAGPRSRERNAGPRSSRPGADPHDARPDLGRCRPSARSGPAAPRQGTRCGGSRRRGLPGTGMARRRRRPGRSPAGGGRRRTRLAPRPRPPDKRSSLVRRVCRRYQRTSTCSVTRKPPFCRAEASCWADRPYD
jgi:hypothetical protein